MNRESNRPFAQIPRLPVGGQATLDDVVAALASINALVADIKDQLYRQRQRGYVISLVVDVIGGQAAQDIVFKPSLFNLVIINTSALLTVQYKVPFDNAAIWTNILPTETQNPFFIEGLIDSVGLQVIGAGTAQVRLIGTF